MTVHRVVFSPQAEADIVEAADWYRRQDTSLANEFLAEVRSTIARAGENPYLYQRLRLEPDVRRALTKRFPYRVFFRRREGIITVFRVLHAARHDREWKRHIPKD